MKWYSPQDAAKILNVSVRTIYRWTKRKKPPVPMRKFGGQWRINLEGIA